MPLKIEMLNSAWKSLFSVLVCKQNFFLTDKANEITMYMAKAFTYVEGRAILKAGVIFYFSWAKDF